jgi:hypothetical protein
MTKRELIEALEALDVDDDIIVVYEYDSTYIIATQIIVAYGMLSIS